MTAWMTRAGRDGVWLERFLEQEEVGIGFGGGLGHDVVRLERDLIVDAWMKRYPSHSKGKARTSVGQLIRFVRGFDSGDTVVTYDQDQRRYIIGELKGDAEYVSEGDEGGPAWTREVEWSAHVLRDSLSTAAKNSLGSTLTLFELKEAYLTEMLALAAPLNEPLNLTPASASEPDEVDASSEADQTAEALADRAQYLIQDRIVALDWAQMEQLIAGILRAMGYRTRVSDPGPDRGVDVFASPDGLGLEEPRIFVEVKHRPGTPMGAPALRAFIGGRRQGDRCIYLSTGGFTREARYEADRANVPLRLVNLSELTLLLLENYARLDEPTRALIPLTMLYWPVE